MKINSKCILTDSFIFFVLFTFAFSKITSEIIKVDFYKAMSCTNNFVEKNLKTNKDWIFLEKIYQQNFVNSKLEPKVGKIPKIIHYIWLGPKPLPNTFERFSNSWKKFHPNWQIILWRDNDVKKFGLKNQAKFDAATNWGAKSDIARYEILYRHGGLYIDHDFECFSSFDVLHDSFDFYAGIVSIHDNGDPAIANGLIGSVPGHPILNLCINKIAMQVAVSTDFCDIMEKTGPYLFTKCFLEYARTNSDNVLALPVSYMFPMPSLIRFETYNYDDLYARYFKPESLCAHYWACSWQK